MTKQVDQKLSQLLDGELEQHDRDEVINLIKDSEEHRKQFSRYSMIREAMKGNLSSCCNSNLADRIRNAMENEPTLLVPNAFDRKTKPVEPEAPKTEFLPGQTAAFAGNRPRGLSLPMIGLATAATVAFVSVFTLPMGQNQDMMPGLMSMTGQQDANVATVNAPARASAGNNVEFISRPLQSPVLIRNGNTVQWVVAEQHLSEGQWKRLENDNFAAPAVPKNPNGARVVSFGEQATP